MNKLTKITFLTLLLLLALPLRQFGQTPYRQYADDGVVLDFFQIDDFYFRVCLLYNLNHDDRFILTQSEEWGEFSVNANDERINTGFYDTFEAFYNNTYTDFGFLSKTDIDDRMPHWKDNIPDTQFLSIMMDIVMRSNRPVNNHCVDSDPFCTSDVITFAAATTSQTADQLEGTTLQDGCIGSSYNPSWFHMRIQTGGQFIIHAEGHDPNNGTNRDIDFCIWGPYTNPTTPCVAQLTTDKIIDCCYSASYSEDIYLGYQPANHVHNTSHGTVYYHLPEVGEYYILMITNFSQQPCTISFTKTPNSGPGETDCGILPGVVTNDGPYCVGETIHLSVNAQEGATYSWTGPAGFSSNQQNPSRPNCTLNMAGTYTCTTTVGSQSVTASTEVIIYPMPTANFNFTTVCVGTPTQFTSTSTTNPSGQQIQSYNWNFGDGQTGSGPNPTHTYANPGSYQVILAVGCGGHCTSQITKTVSVYGQPTSNFTYTTVCKGTPTEFTSTATPPQGQQINSYQWNFGDGQTGSGQTVSHTYAQAGNYQVTHTVGVGSGDCTGTMTHTVPVYATPTPTATAQPPVVIYGGVATLTANAGTTGSFTFHWEPANKVVSPNSQTTQTIPLQETTIFTCTVTNPEGNCTGSTQVTVSIDGSNMTAIATADQTEICEGESTTLHAQPAGGTGNYTFSWTPANTLNNANIQHPVATPPVGTTTYTCHVSDGLSSQDVTVTIRVYPNMEADVYHTICEDDTYNFFGDMLQTPGVYDHTIQTIHGCDSIIHLHLSNWDTYETPITRHFCQGESYDFFGNSLCEAGTYYHTLESVHGCDSVIKLNLVQDPMYEVSLTESTCEGGEGYYYHGDYLQPSAIPYIYVFETVMGCDSVVSLHIEESEYNSKTYNISLCATEYTWPSNGLTYYETGTYYDTLSFASSCDSTIVLNLELRRSTDTLVQITSCDSYHWVDSYFDKNLWFEESHHETYDFDNEYHCPSHVTLDLTINHQDVTDFTVSDEENCNEYFWDPQGHEIIYTDHEDPVYNLSGEYHRTYKNIRDCDSVVTMHVHFQYTPHPTEIHPMDATNTAPHWLVTATEFQINSYDFNLWDTNPNCSWDSVTWTCDEAPNWVLEPFGNKGECCKVYVINYVEDTIWLRAHAFNRCAPSQGIEQKYWILCSFYGVEEMESSLANFDVIPNPNNGQMQLNFEYLTGKVNIKVYDMRGTLIDSFDTYNSNGPSSHLYTMKNNVDGIYFFVATSKEGTVAKKVVIQK